MRRAGWRWAAGGLALVAVLVALWPLRVLVPMVRDDMKLDGVVWAVALDWRDFGLPSAIQRLQYELDRSGIGPWVEESRCGLRSLEGGEREVRCVWDVEIDHDLFGWRFPLAFESVARLDADGQPVR